MNFVGFDTSLRSTGIGIISNGVSLATVIKPETTEFYERLMEIVDRSFQWLDPYCRDGITFIMTERPFQGMNKNTNLKLAGVWGALVQGALARGYAVRDAHPSHLKLFAVGSGRGQKAEIKRAVLDQWGFEHESDDAIDAIVLAHMARCHYRPKHYTDMQREIITEIIGKSSSVGICNSKGAR